jgi:ADP-ribosylglycohydrolase
MTHFLKGSSTMNVLASYIKVASEHIAREDYAERVYAALLGKVIGVYVGRPFEGWTYERITQRFGEIDRYVAEELGKAVVVTDDDIAGTLTFIRAAEDSGRGYGTTSDDVADCWLNYLIENRSVLWWGGMGNSTEHTAYLRLKSGYRPPYSGSAELNGRVVSEQIGAQIFIDGWALIAPGAPMLAAELARRAAVVSHDGEAIYGAQMIAAMEAAAFATHDVEQIIDAGLSTIPPGSLVATLVADVRAWHTTEPDWRIARQHLQGRYGYQIYGGGCHIIPNHGLIILALLYGGGDFSRSMTIVNTAGWDTDCNSGNVGCLLGLISGLKSIDAATDWRGPVADRIYVPTADVGSGITDVVTQARRIVAIATSAAGLEQNPERVPRFNFDFPGSLQGFQLQGEGALTNEPLPGGNGRGLRVASRKTVELTTPTFIPPDAREMKGYALEASPTIYSGQTMELSYWLTADADGADTTVTPLIRHYDGRDQTVAVYGRPEKAQLGGNRVTWIVPNTDGQPISHVGLVVTNANGCFLLESLDWTGTPVVDFIRPKDNGSMWRRAWVSETDFEHPDPDEGIRLIANSERRLAVTGTSEWRDYTVEADVTAHLGEAMGLAARVQGRQRYYLLRCDSRGEAQLIRRDGTDHVLARVPFTWTVGKSRNLHMVVVGTTVTARIDGGLVGSIDDAADALTHGGIGLACEVGRVGCSGVRVTSA